MHTLRVKSLILSDLEPIHVVSLSFEVAFTYMVSTLPASIQEVSPSILAYRECDDASEILAAS
jgi:hypothetical protein